MTAASPREILDILLRERTAEDREWLIQAWERFGDGDPQSLPALYALTDRFSLDAHAALLQETNRLHGDIKRMSAELATKTEEAARLVQAAANTEAETAARFKELVTRLEKSAGEQGTQAMELFAAAKQASLQIVHDLEKAKREAAKGDHWWTAGALAVFFAIFAVAGFWTGGAVKLFYPFEKSSAEETRDLGLPRPAKTEKDRRAAGVK
ncbi:hypothetical protein [Luteolibacter sp.]|uniref:hypothetical protein n=1 Tax=Luteolibacter sp. TaxID=1962973 RepID=UPI003265C43D